MIEKRDHMLGLDSTTLPVISSKCLSCVWLQIEWTGSSRNFWQFSHWSCTGWWHTLQCFLTLIWLPQFLQLSTRMIFHLKHQWEYRNAEYGKSIYAIVWFCMSWHRMSMYLF